MNDIVRGDIGARRISHIVLNVSDLDRSTQFYGDLQPLRQHSEGTVKLDASAGLGIDGPVDFRWRIVGDGTYGDPTRVMLAEWTTPELVGEAYPDITSVGIVKFAFNYPDLATKLARLQELGIEPTNPPQRNYITVLDPDGTTVSFRQVAGSPAEQLFHVHVSTYDLDRQLAFWEGVIGLEYSFANVPTEPRPASQGPNGHLVQWNSHFVSHPSDTRFFVDIGRYVYPEPHGEPHRAANAIGLAMIVIEVEDLEAARAALQSSLEPFSATEAQVQGGIEVWPWGDGPDRRVLHLRDPDGNLVQLMERLPSAVTRTPWPG